MDSAIPVKIYDPKVHDRIITIPTEPAYDWARQLGLKEGLLVGPSAGGAFYGCLEAIRGIDEGVAVVIFADGGDKYLSTQLFDE